jgi:hypothetical protein
MVLQAWSTAVIQTTNNTIAIHAKVFIGLTTNQNGTAADPPQCPSSQTLAH